MTSYEGLVWLEVISGMRIATGFGRILTKRFPEMQPPRFGITMTAFIFFHFDSPVSPSSVGHVPLLRA
jgi:hypothetical protein